MKRGVSWGKVAMAEKGHYQNNMHFQGDKRPVDKYRLVNNNAEGTGKKNRSQSMCKCLQDVTS